MTGLQAILNLGQSIWLDYIDRPLLIGGEFENLLKKGVRGVTSNPSIFEKAITGTNRYDSSIERLAKKGLSAEGIYEHLALDDIARAADLLIPIYEESDGIDGYVSLEVDPLIAFDSEKTVSEARRLYRELDRPNIYIKVPATEQGMISIEELIGSGVNVNVTLIFSLEQYKRVCMAYIAGIENLIANSGDPSRMSSVASFFVSRIDSKVDKALADKGIDGLSGQIAISMAKVAYSEYKDAFSSDRWKGLSSSGARPQRLLWASTSTKNPEYSKTMYVDRLIGPGTVNTLPMQTLELVMRRKDFSVTIDNDVNSAVKNLFRLNESGIDIEDICEHLLDEGVEKFAKSFKSLIESIDSKIKNSSG